MKGDTLIGLFKLVKALLLLLVAAGALSLVDNSLRDAALKKISQLSGDAHFRVLSKVASYLGFANDRKLELVSAASFFYASLFATEGIGLLLQKRWAEYLTAIITASFLPVEGYELFRRSNLFKVLLLAINIAVVVYLVLRLRSPKS